MSQNQKQYIADIYPGKKQELDDELICLLCKLQCLCENLPLWLFLHEDQIPLSYEFQHEFLEKKSQISSEKPALLLIDSPGGDARAAYQIARLFNRRAGFIALIPRYAKSAATLLALGAHYIYMGLDAELGPLDAQLRDVEREGIISALDEVHALERLNAAALEVFDQTMRLVVGRTGKKIESVLPNTLEYTANFIRPLIENIDAVHYTQMARVLRVSEEYAIRLLSSNSKHTEGEARSIAGHLVEQYPEHGFVIDSNEAKEIGLKIQRPSEELNQIFDALIPKLNNGLTLLGQFKEMNDDDETQTSSAESDAAPTSGESRHSERGGNSDSNVEEK